MLLPTGSKSTSSNQLRREPSQKSLPPGYESHSFEDANVQQQDAYTTEHKERPHDPDGNELKKEETGVDTTPRMNIVLMLAGSKDDILPYISFGTRLLLDGHRVRFATHAFYRSLVEEFGPGLEFFDIGGEPQHLTDYLTKNPGIAPGFAELTVDSVRAARKTIWTILNSCWAACYTPDLLSRKAFVADAILANPQCFAHIHCAEALKIPLIMTSTTPWSPTAAFPHPLVKSNFSKRLTNQNSFYLFEYVSMQGILDLINDFRADVLGLEYMSIISAPSVLHSLRIPWVYCMSPAIASKPTDWGEHIDITGYIHPDTRRQLSPPQLLTDFLEAWSPPVYFDFGAVVVDNPTQLTQTIIDASGRAGVRAIISAPWVDTGLTALHPEILVARDMPLDWLLQDGRVCGVVQSGSADTTNLALRAAIPTTIVTFTSDQDFWATALERLGVGAAPVPISELSVDRLAEAITYMQTTDARMYARAVADRMSIEDGAGNAVKGFYKQLHVSRMACDLDPTRAAAWWSKKYCLRLSCYAAQELASRDKLKIEDLKPFAAQVYDTSSTSTAVEPVTELMSAGLWGAGQYFKAAGELFYSPVSGVSRMVVAAPHTGVKLIGGMSDGFQNLPSLYGAPTRQPGKVTGIKSGMREGISAFRFGMADGIRDFVMEPVHGAQKNGVVGAVVGTLRGTSNLLVRPAAGICGLVAHPTRGLWSDLTVMAARKSIAARRASRVQQGRHEADSATRDDAHRINKAFEESYRTFPERKARHPRRKQAVETMEKGKGKAISRSDIKDEYKRRILTDRLISMHGRSNSSSASLAGRKEDSTWKRLR